MAKGQLSNRGFEFLKKHEGFRNKPYKAVSTEKFYTVGLGHYGDDVKADRIYTDAECMALFAQDKKKFEDDVNKVWHEPMTQGMFDALFSLAYNTGNVSRGVFKDLLAGDGWMNTDKVISTWKNFKCTSGGKTLKGLVNRRANEVALFYSDEADGGPFTGNPDDLPPNFSLPNNDVNYANNFGSGSSGGFQNISSSGIPLTPDSFASTVFGADLNETDGRTRIYAAGDVTLIVDELSMPMDFGSVKDTVSQNQENSSEINA